MMTKRSILAGLILLLALCLVGTAAAANGFLNVDSDPQTALIYIGDVSPGSFIGYTPMSFQIAEGDYNLILKKIGYEDVLQPIHVTNNTITSVSITLTPVLWNEAGGIHLVTTPPGASAFIKQDDQPDSAYFFLGTTPLTFSSLTPGDYTIKIVLPGYYDYVLDTTVEMALVNEIDIKLDKIPTTGFADLRTEPPGATVTIDGSFAGNTTFPLILELAPGTHMVLFELDGYEDYPDTFDIVVGATTNEWVTLERLPSDVAVYFTSVPTGAEIYIDGVELENVTPILESIEYDPDGNNMHNVTFELDGYKDFIGMLDLNSWFQGGEMYRYPTVVLEPLHIDICEDLASGGTIVPADGDPVVEYGEDKTYYIEGAGPSWEILDYVIDGTKVNLTHNETFYQYTFPDVVENHTICAHFVRYHVRINATAGPGGSISPQGIFDVPPGTEPVFTFTPDECYKVVAIVANNITYQWSGNSAQFPPLHDDLDVRVLFDLETFDVTATAVNPEGGTVDPATQTVDCGESATVNIAPANGFMIKSITDNGEIKQPTTPTSYVIDEVENDRDVMVTFQAAEFTITSSIDAESTGTGTIEPLGDTKVPFGESLTFTITPGECSALLTLKVDGEYTTPSPIITFVNVTADHTIEANFTMSVPTITATAGEGGTITPEGSVVVDCGEDQIFELVPDECHMIDDILIDGVEIEFDDANLTWFGTPGGQGVAANYTFFDVTTDHQIELNFDIAMFNVTTIAGLNGLIHPSNVTVECNGSVALTITPFTGFAVNSVTVTPPPDPPLPPFPPQGGTITLSNITDDILVEATFVTNAVADFEAVVQPVDMTRIPLRYLDPIAQPGMDIKFYDLSTGEGIFAWSWNFGDGNYSSERNPIHRYAEIGEYDVTLKVRNAAGWSNPTVKEDYIIITNDPLVDFSFEPATGNVPPRVTVQFTDETVDITGASHTIVWTFGDGSPPEVGRNPQHTYIIDGTYTVTLTYDSRVSMSKQIIITANPVADFIGFPTRGNHNLTVQFTDLSQSAIPLATWFWNFGDGSFSTDQNPGHTYYTPGKYNVTLNVTNTPGDFNITKKVSYIDVR